MVYVSVSAYDDGDLLPECLASIRRHLPDAHVAVVDGRYETWPAPNDNSTDDTPDIAAQYDAEYRPDGPYPLEDDKHRHRLAIAPDGERCLFMDSDERLVQYDDSNLDPDTPYDVRFHQPLVYNDTHGTKYYWRSFKPEWVEEVKSTDLYVFDRPKERTDEITVVHRHDLRNTEYRTAKYERFDEEGRQGPYRKQLEKYLNDEWDVEFTECPDCGLRTMSSTRITPFGADGRLSRVHCCTNGDCYMAVEHIDIGPHRYVPDEIETGYEEDPDRLRLELLDAGVHLLTYHHAYDFHPDILAWMVEHDPARDEWPVTVG